MQIEACHNLFLFGGFGNRDGICWITEALSKDVTEILHCQTINESSMATFREVCMLDYQHMGQARGKSWRRHWSDGYATERVLEWWQLLDDGRRRRHWNDV